PPRRAGRARAGRLRPRGRGAAPRVRDSRDRARPPLAALDPPGLDPRAARLMAASVLTLANVRVSYGGADVLDVPSRAIGGGAVLARAPVVAPDLLLLDEPFAGLDAPSREALLPELAAILRGDRVTTVLVSHDRGEAQALADRVAVLMRGRILQLDETARVFH